MGSSSTSNSETTKILQYLPLHPRFSLFFSTFTTVSGLYIFDLTFGNFNDLARMINSLPALRRLVCNGVRCVTLGPLPFNMKPRADRVHAPGKPFASNLGEPSLVCTQRYAWHASNTVHLGSHGHTLRPKTGICMWATSQGIDSSHALLSPHRDGPA
ncbi:hypothetical protein DICSQDRAFT_69791 [Dichomitus squalens LYAD-421 SS1]|uniref:Uncharacterized protein n=1 Tax=Dichomitus squalens (strain LYAD-421) TaxID=732165 RepID=R7SMC2_DICSQ|nr:uncharacterized protein DICSQDRAFT_69791 [Dichomitus squalens LYAD-421 SS1]EJF57276.1 hypothetical protein DICSQDRAFT_69791 [Dichomitus squalens LYAD-421 SS1]